MLHLIDIDGFRQLYPRFKFGFRYDKDYDAEIVTITYGNWRIKRMIPSHVVDSPNAKEIIERVINEACEELKLVME